MKDGGGDGNHAGAFEQHILEAIELNSHRSRLYAEASGGASVAISESLLKTERFLLPVARWFDRRAARYHDAGIPLLQDVFVPMAGAPEFVPRVLVRPLTAHRPPKAAAVRRKVAAAVRADGFEGGARVISRELDRMKAHRDCCCMLRHLLESALRVCSVADLHDVQARERGLPSPAWISKLLLRLHLWALSDASRMDARAYPLQRRGIPILCRDVPPIPRYP